MPVECVAIDRDYNSSPVDYGSTVNQLLAEMSYSCIIDTVALSQAQRVYQTNITDLGRSFRLVDTRDPIVAPPVRKQVRIVESEDVDMCPVHEVVREDARVAAVVVRSHYTNARWIVLFQCRDKLFCPTARQHPRVVVDAVEVVDVVEVGFQHRVVLSPCRLSSVVALH